MDEFSTLWETKVPGKKCQNLKQTMTRTSLLGRRSDLIVCLRCTEVTPLMWTPFIWFWVKSIQSYLPVVVIVGSGNKNVESIVEFTDSNNQINALGYPVGAVIMYQACASIVSVFNLYELTTSNDECIWRT